MKQDDFITVERVRILYERALAGIVAALLSTLIIAYIFRGQVALPVVLAWVGFMSILAVVRYWLLFDYKKNRQNTLRHEKYENRFAYASGLVGIGWAFCIVWALHLPALEYRLYGLLLLVAVVAISVPIYSSSIKTVCFYITPSVVISIPLLLSRGGNETLLGLALIIFSTLVMLSSRDIHNTLIDTFTLRFKTKVLADNLNQLNDEKSETEQRMQGILDHAPASIYVRDLEGRFAFVNQEVADVLHLRNEEIIGKSLHDVYSKDIADELLQNDVDVIRARRPVEYVESVMQDGELRHHISTKFPLFDETGKLFAVGGISTDITERVHAEESLRISQQRLLLHREQSPFGVIEWNTDFQFTDWNRAAQRIFGYSREEVLGRHITETILPDSALEAVNEVWRDLLENKGGAHSINENVDKNGRTILCEWHNTPLVDDDGKVIGVASLVDDITARQKNEEDLRRSQKMDAMGKLTGGIAHDFNNLLNIVLGFSELLKNGLSGEDPSLITYSDHILDAGHRASKLTTKLLEFSRTSTSSAEPASINKVLRGMQHMLETTLTLRINPVFDLSESLWTVWLDKARLEDAILNICINSMHAMPDGGTLSLTTCNAQLTDSDIVGLDIVPGDYALLSVSDTGVGMTGDVQQKVFDPFFTTKGEKGTGLGMSQVYGFVQQSGGYVQVRSKPGHGTRVSIYFPRYRESKVAKPKENTAVSAKLLSGQETILVVDDEVALRDLTEQVLTTNGYTVLCAESAAQALEILETRSVDLLLCDVIMPGMDGHQLATEVEKCYPKVLIQLVSGFSDVQNISQANDALHQQRIKKPYRSEKLLLRLRELLDNGKMEQAN